MTERRRELRAGLARTRRYLLSHHRPAAWDRCHAVEIRGRTVRLCARCSGLYPGILVGLALFATGVGRPLWPFLVAALPAPALVDWAATAGDDAGSNTVRTVTGASLGVAYGVALPWFLSGTALVLAVAVGYGTLAAVGLRWRGRI